MIVAVGSTNPTKIKPVEEIFTRNFKNVNVTGVKFPTGVTEQPLTDDEMYRGALNRAKKALNQVAAADYGVGIEGGVHHYPYGLFERSLVVIVNRSGKVGVGSSGGLILPDKVIALIHRGKTLEEAVDQLCGTHKIGEGIGMFGVFTNSAVTRSEGVKHGVAFALARFLHPELYDEK
jgi:inosine/xanthosine triphosphatase